MANKKLPTQADLKAAMDIINRWSKNQAPLEQLTSIAAVKEMPDSGDMQVTLLKQREAVSGLDPPPGVHVDFKPGLVQANSWGQDDPDQPVSISFFAVDRKPVQVDREETRMADIKNVKEWGTSGSGPQLRLHRTGPPYPHLRVTQPPLSSPDLKQLVVEDLLSLAAGDPAATFAAVKEMPKMPSRGLAGRVYVTHVDVTYDEERHDHIGHRQTYSPGRTKMRVEFELPPDMNPDDVLSKVRQGDFSFAAQEPEPLHAPAQALEHRGMVAMLAKQREDLDLLRKTAADNETTLLQIRKRMNAAMDAIQDRGVAAELYAEIVDRWASSLAEGAAFTAAEGKELVDALASALEYMDLARETRRLEHGEHEKGLYPPTSDDTLF